MSVRALIQTNTLLSECIYQVGDIKKLVILKKVNVKIGMAIFKKINRLTQEIDNEFKRRLKNFYNTCHFNNPKRKKRKRKTNEILKQAGLLDVGYNNIIRQIKSK